MAVLVEVHGVRSLDAIVAHIAFVVGHVVKNERGHCGGVVRREG